MLIRYSPIVMLTWLFLSHFGSIEYARAGNALTDDNSPKLLFLKLVEKTAVGGREVPSFKIFLEPFIAKHLDDPLAEKNLNEIEVLAGQKYYDGYALDVLRALWNVNLVDKVLSQCERSALPLRISGVSDNLVYITKDAREFMLVQELGSVLSIKNPYTFFAECFHVEQEKDRDVARNSFKAYVEKEIVKKSPASEISLSEWTWQHDSVTFVITLSAKFGLETRQYATYSGLASSSMITTGCVLNPLVARAIEPKELFNRIERIDSMRRDAKLDLKNVSQVKLSRRNVIVSASDFNLVQTITVSGEVPPNDGGSKIQKITISDYDPNELRVVATKQENGDYVIEINAVKKNYEHLQDSQMTLGVQFENGVVRSETLFYKKSP